MNKTKKLILAFSSIMLSLVLIVAGVYAALTYGADITGRINIETATDILVSVNMEIRSDEPTYSDFTLYGNKPSSIASMTVSTPPVDLGSAGTYIVHRFTFQNHGAEAVDVLVSLADAETGNSLYNNFDCFATLENDTSTTHALDFESTLDAGGSGIVYVWILIKDVTSDSGEITVDYIINITFEIH